MYLGRRYGFRAFLVWTRRELFILAGWSFAVTAVVHALPGHLLRLPVAILAVLGTALAIMLGFKNQECHARVREALMSLGQIRNGSLILAGRVASAWEGQDPQVAKGQIREFCTRHIAWLTVWRYALRQPKEWENLHEAGNARFMKQIPTPESQVSLLAELGRLLNEDQVKTLMAFKADKASALIADQYAQVGRWRHDHGLDGNAYTGILGALENVMNGAAACTRIKIFPYARNYFSIALILVWGFAGLIPFAFLPFCEDMGGTGTSSSWTLWLNVPMSAMAGWVYVTLEKVGENSSNPFEGGPNDVPISAIVRLLEIEYRTLMGEATDLELLEPRFSVLH